MNLSVYIATYYRTDRLRVLLKDLAKQSLMPDEVVIADNDASPWRLPWLACLSVGIAQSRG
jgi:GT2 family glycosyltransferase